MKEHIDEIIQEELSNIQPSIHDFYQDDDLKINELINKQNENVARSKILKILEDLKKSGVSLHFTNDMSLEELEEILNHVQM